MALLGQGLVSDFITLEKRKCWLGRGWREGITVGRIHRVIWTDGKGTEERMRGEIRRFEEERR